jgi:hypothetical protein
VKYELGTDGRPVISKDTIIELVESSRDGLATKPGVLIAAARRFAPPPERRGDETWARTVIDYPATLRVFEKMVKDQLLTGMQAYEWRVYGVQTFLQNRTSYYATARRSSEIFLAHQTDIDQKLWREAEMSAMQVLASRYPAEFSDLVTGMYDDLSANPSWPRPSCDRKYP